MRKIYFFSLLLALGALTFWSAPAQGQTPSTGQVEVSQAIKHDVSPALRDIPTSTRTDAPREKPLRLIPMNGLTGNQNDPIAQTTVGPNVATTTGLNFDGVGDTSNTPSNPCNCAPPDTNGAVGATQYVQYVNTGFAVYDKVTGAIASGFPKAGNTLWAGFGGACQTNNDGDPIVQYDKAAGRWVFTQFSVSTTPYLQCVAVSTTSDATGTYNRYAFSYGNTQFPDYPKLGVWSDAYYITFNIFNNGTTFAGAKLCAYDRAAMLAGAAATQECFQLSNSFGGVLPSDLDGATAPPAGSPNYLFNFGSNSLNEWKFHADFITPANASLTGPINIPVAAFAVACNGGTCIAQPNTRNQLDSLADRLMYRLAYRVLNGVETLVVNHSVKVSGNNRNQVVGVRWYQLTNPNAAGGATVAQQGTYSPDSTSRWMGSIAMDKVGDIALGYSASSGSVFPSIRYTGRVPTDPSGTMEAENSILAGSASQTGSLHRWGDYSAMSVDPSNDCTFFYTTEYLKTSGSFNWSTRIASFKFPGCQ